MTSHWPLLTSWCAGGRNCCMSTRYACGLHPQHAWRYKLSSQEADVRSGHPPPRWHVRWRISQVTKYRPALAVVTCLASCPTDGSRLVNMASCQHLCGLRASVQPNADLKVPACSHKPILTLNVGSLSPTFSRPLSERLELKLFQTCSCIWNAVSSQNRIFFGTLCLAHLHTYNVLQGHTGRGGEGGGGQGSQVDEFQQVMHDVSCMICEPHITSHLHLSLNSVLCSAWRAACMTFETCICSKKKPPLPPNAPQFGQLVSLMPEGSLLPHRPQLSACFAAGSALACTQCLAKDHATSFGETTKRLISVPVTVCTTLHPDKVTQLFCLGTRRVFHLF